MIGITIALQIMKRLVTANVHHLPVLAVAGALAVSFTAFLFSLLAMLRCSSSKKSCWVAAMALGVSISGMVLFYLAFMLVLL